MWQRNSSHAWSLSESRNTTFAGMLSSFKDPEQSPTVYREHIQTHLKALPKTRWARTIDAKPNGHWYYVHTHNAWSCYLSGWARALSRISATEGVNTLLSMSQTTSHDVHVIILPFLTIGIPKHNNIHVWLIGAIVLTSIMTWSLWFNIIIPLLVLFRKLDRKPVYPLIIV